MASSRQLPPRIRTCTQAEVARAAGVSPSVVSAVLSGRNVRGLDGEGISFAPATAARVLAACRGLNFRPHAGAARTRVYPAEGDFAFLLSSGARGGIANPYFARLFQGALQALPLNRQMTFALFDPAVDYLSAPERQPLSLRSGAATRFLIAGDINYSLVLAIQRRGGVAVYLSRHLPQPGMVSIIPDYSAATRLALRHLCELGHRRLVYIQADYFAPDTFSTRSFLRGLAASACALGLPFGADLVMRATLTDGAAMAGLMQQLQARRPRPTALFCFNDETARAVVRAAAASGVAVPGRLSVVGCQDDATCTAEHPFLTTVHFPAEKMGRQGVMTLDAAFERLPRRKCAVLPVTLVVRETTAAPGV